MLDPIPFIEIVWSTLQLQYINIWSLSKTEESYENANLFNIRVLQYYRIKDYFRPVLFSSFQTFKIFSPAEIPSDWFGFCVDKTGQILPCIQHIL